ncbi:hypothetical protein C8R44DRAFT_738737 [Mycena epipterygia]|nr:hypothetical protein C8R44DRAFT_738737 [Mycena epipterygia]
MCFPRLWCRSQAICDHKMWYTLVDSTCTYFGALSEFEGTCERMQVLNRTRDPVTIAPEQGFQWEYGPERNKLASAWRRGSTGQPNVGYMCLRILTWVYVNNQWVIICLLGLLLPRGGGGSIRVSARLGRLPYTAPRGDLGSSWLDIYQITFPFMASAVPNFVFLNPKKSQGTPICVVDKRKCILGPYSSKILVVDHAVSSSQLEVSLWGLEVDRVDGPSARGQLQLSSRQH